MKTDPASILAALATLAPSVAFLTEWTPDPDCRFYELTGPGGAFENEDPADWSCWQSETTATAIVGGEPVTGSAYLGGTWERYGDDPATINPDVSGYLPQLLDEAATELAVSLPHPAHAPILSQIAAARDYLARVMRARYDEQRRHLDAMAP